MSEATTSGVRIPGLKKGWSDAFELLSSMRFAISLLTIICIASVVGTVIQQNQPLVNYMNQFGPFWFEVFGVFSLYTVYNAPWFVVIMAFLVISTTFCLIRTTPKMLKDMRSFKEQIRVNSLRSFPNRLETETAVPTDLMTARVEALLRHRGFAIKRRQEGEGTLLAAKAGNGHRWGYIFTHAAIVVICIGGLLDSTVPVRTMVWLFDKEPIVDNMLIAEVPESGRLPLETPSFRANALIPEGGATRYGIVLSGDGALLQPLPFELTLDRFIIEYWPNGMPSLFASEVTVRDLDTGETFQRRIEVNDPLVYRGMTVYQASFDDGGSELRLKGWPLQGPVARSFEVEGIVGMNTELLRGNGLAPYQLEFSAFRPMNVENLSQAQSFNLEEEAQRVTLRGTVAGLAGSAVVTEDRGLRNVGPSVQYKLRDDSGQAREYHNYMFPIELDGFRVYLAGMRDNPNDEFRYLRIPADLNDRVDEFMHLRAALNDPQVRSLAATRFALANVPPGSDQQTIEQLRDSGLRALETFAGDGLRGIAQLLEQSVPPEEQQRAADVVVRLLGGMMSEVRDIMREQQGLPAITSLSPDEQSHSIAWLQLAVAALSDLSFYPAPIWLGLEDYTHVQASVFQIARAPGMYTVYAGCLFLIIGIFAMFYVRERRIWVWLRPEGSGSQLMLAMTAQRRTLDFQREFDRLVSDTQKLASAPVSNRLPSESTT